MKEYSSDRTSMQAAMMDMIKSNSGGQIKSKFIRYDRFDVTTGYWIDVPKEFSIRLEFISDPDSNQGVDISVKDGHLTLSDSSRVKLLRTWNDPKYENTVTYTGYSKSGSVLVYNVYKVSQNGKLVDSMWTGNAGMLVEQAAYFQYLFKCSAHDAKPPTFDALVFKVTIGPAQS